ncbi:MAG: formylglycine-generating enzyme family protein [Candidatus Thiothrix putei]|uniref:Formylglycine-generating enzyme family protein n=1 Tax=Candidatus Thiothrix putei TaxID=3080811 RepID=A0AA95H956_9GAMM|nr:MAG: formylglycine-generating enzyme family protein [Candidatus Thiothrix putei]
MSSRVSRADLLLFLEQQDSGELDSILDCFGYQHVPAQRPLNLGGDAQEVSSAPERRKPLLERDSGLVPSALPPEVFYVVQGQEVSSLLPAPKQPGQPDVPDWVASIQHEALDLEAGKRRYANQPQPHQPLVAWTTLWPLLRKLLSQQQTHKHPDIPKLVKQVAKAEQLRRIPQQQRLNWTAKVVILVDRPPRLDGLNRDYVMLQAQLGKQRGEVGVESWFVLDLPTRSMLLGDERKTWHPPTPETPILILSDLGIYERSGQITRQWLRFGQSLRQAGCQAFALVPAPVRYLSEELTQCFQCISWDRYSKLIPVSPTATTPDTVQQRMAEDQHHAGELLALAIAATEIEPAFLRSLRYQFSVGKPWDIGHELLVWNHAAVEYGSNAVVLDAEAQQHYRDHLATLLTRQPELAEPLYWHVRQQLAHTFTLDYADALCFLGALAGINGDERLEEAERYLKQYILATHQQAQHRGLLFNGQLLLERQGNRSRRHNDYFSSLWAITQQRLGSNAPRPDWLNHGAANAFLTHPTDRKRVQLIQYGERFYLGTPKALQSLQVPGFAFQPYVLAEVEADQDLVIAEYEGETTDHYLSNDGYLQWAVTGKSRILHIGGQRLVVEALTRPEWAGGFSCSANGWEKPAIQPTGEDKYGVYFDLVLPASQPFPERSRREHLTQRFRYIPPQTFLMGSPEDEPGHYDRETQHNVTLTQGYWLADTTVTQAFWETVMGANPSYFKGAQRPVETVSWDDTQTFIQKLQQHWQLLDVRLPLEAEWECACRAGTTSAFSFGGKDDLNTKKVNYSGKWNNYNSDGETKPVKSYSPNAWGLYEMHGNVFEWCQDAWQATLPAEPVTDPDGAGGDTGRRVVRGGSWDREGRCCRSAYRPGYAPDRRLHTLGFRLALGHPSSSAAEPPNR